MIVLPAWRPAMCFRNIAANLASHERQSARPTVWFLFGALEVDLLTRVCKIPALPIEKLIPNQSLFSRFSVAFSLNGSHVGLAPACHSFQKGKRTLKVGARLINLFILITWRSDRNETTYQNNKQRGLGLSSGPNSVW